MGGLKSRVPSDLAIEATAARTSVISSSPAVTFEKIRTVLVLARIGESPNSANERSGGLSAWPLMFSVFLGFGTKESCPWPVPTCSM